jgi:hypothetical protein
MNSKRNTFHRFCHGMDTNHSYTMSIEIEMKSNMNDVMMFMSSRRISCHRMIRWGQRSLSHLVIWNSRHVICFGHTHRSFVIHWCCPMFNSLNQPSHSSAQVFDAGQELIQTASLVVFRRTSRHHRRIRTTNLSRAFSFFAFERKFEMRPVIRTDVRLSPN